MLPPEEQAPPNNVDGFLASAEGANSGAMSMPGDPDMAGNAANGPPSLPTMAELVAQNTQNNSAEAPTVSGIIKEEPPIATIAEEPRQAAAPEAVAQSRVPDLPAPNMNHPPEAMATEEFAEVPVVETAQPETIFEDPDQETMKQAADKYAEFLASREAVTSVIYTKKISKEEFAKNPLLMREVEETFNKVLARLGIIPGKEIRADVWVKEDLSVEVRQVQLGVFEVLTDTIVVKDGEVCRTLYVSKESDSTIAEYETRTLEDMLRQIQEFTQEPRTILDSGEIGAAQGSKSRGTVAAEMCDKLLDALKINKASGEQFGGTSPASRLEVIYGAPQIIEDTVSYKAVSYELPGGYHLVVTTYADNPEMRSIVVRGSQLLDEPIKATSEQGVLSVTHNIADSDLAQSAQEI